MNLLGKKPRQSSSKKVEWAEAYDIDRRVGFLIESARIDWVDKRHVICFRSINTNTRAVARIYGLSKIWQIALDLKPYYVIEVISEKFDNLNQKEKDRTLLHELAHIPKNFSGALLPHRRQGRGNFYSRLRDLILVHENKGR